MKFVKIIVNYTLRQQQTLNLRFHQLLSAQQYRTAEVKPKVSSVFSAAIDHLQYIPRYFDMSTTEALSRHAQTQHGIASAEDESIILCKAALFAQPSVESEKSDAPEGDAQKSTQCVWIHDVEEQSSKSDNVELLPSIDQIQEKETIPNIEKRKAEDTELSRDVKKPKLEAKVLKVKRPGFSEDRYKETSYYMENGLRKVYPYHFTFTTFTKGRWIGEKILDVFAREFRAHPAEEYERFINSGSLSVNYEKVPIDYRLKHNDLLSNVVHRHEVPVTCEPITIVHMDDDIVVVNKPASIPVHPCGRYRHNTVVFILAKEYNLKNLRTIHRLDRLTSGILLFGRNPNKARQLEQQIRSRVVEKEYICRVEGNFPEGVIECHEPIEVVSYKIGVCRVTPKGKECTTTFEKLSYNGKTSVVLCKPLTGRMHQIRVHLQYLGFPIINDPLYNHVVFGPQKGRGGDIGGRTDAELVQDLITIHNAENWLGTDGDADISLFKPIKESLDVDALSVANKLIEKPEELSPEASHVPSGCPPTVDTLNEIPSADILDKAGSDDAGTNTNVGVSTVATQTGHESPDMAFKAEKMTVDKHCYECRVRYRDPKPQDLVMYLHAWKYKGPGWEYETKFPHWGEADWDESK